MVQRILVFENDATFAQEVRKNFEAMGATVDVANDGPQGLDLANAHRPDLILLSIELPGMNGFLVCKKLKKQDGLSDVPLLILSSEATEEVFEQHKKLRTRAEDYLHKPIAFTDLLERAKRFVTFSSNGAAANVASAPAAELEADAEPEITDLDEEVILVADDAEEAEPTQGTREDVDAFADDAVDALLADDAPPEEPAPHAVPMAAVSRVAAPVPSMPVVPPRAERKPSVVGAPSPIAEVAAPAAPSAAGGPELARLQQELQQAQARISALESEVTQADRRAKDAQAELQNAKQRATNAERSLTEATKKGGVSSRELLDLREQLNRKDRELLGLRDQVTSRDKQLIEASDKNLSLERQLADQNDKNLELQREVEKSKELVETLQTDKEGAKKRLDDMKARFDRSEAKVRELGEELNGIKAQHGKELEAAQRQRTEALEAAASAQKAELEEQRRQNIAAIDALRRAHADELAELREEHSVTAAAAREQADQQKQAALSTLRSELSAEAEQRLQAQQKQHEELVSQALAAHENELTSTRQSLQDKHATEMRQTTERFQQELARVGRTLAEVETKQQLLEDQLEEAETAKADSLTRLGRISIERDQKAEQAEELQAQLDHLLAQREADEQVVERVRKALAIGLSLLDEHKRAALDEQAEG